MSNNDNIVDSLEKINFPYTLIEMIFYREEK